MNLRGRDIEAAPIFHSIQEHEDKQFINSKPYSKELMKWGWHENFDADYNLSPFKLCVMLKWAAIFFVIAIIAAIFGFTGIAAGAASIAKILFFIFLVLFILVLIFGAKIFGKQRQYQNQ